MYDIFTIRYVVAARLLKDHSCQGSKSQRYVRRRDVGRAVGNSRNILDEVCVDSRLGFESEN